MSEPTNSNEQIVTPRAEQRVVDGDYIDAEPVETAQTAETANKQAKTKSKPAATRPGSGFTLFLYWLSAVILAGGAAYVAFQALNQTQNMVTQAELNHAYEQQQMQFEIMANQLQQQAEVIKQQPDNRPQLLAEIENLQQQLSEQALVIAQLQAAEANTPNAPTAQIPATPTTTEPQTSAQPNQSVDPKLAENQQKLADSLENLDQRLLELLNSQQIKEQELEELTKKFFEFSKATNERLSSYLESGQWQSDKAEIGDKIGQIETQLGEIARKVSPEVEAMVEELAPQLEGLFSIFNQFFEIKKHAEPADSEAAE